MPWAISGIVMAVGIACVALSERLIENPDTMIYGIALGAVGVGCVAAAQYLQEHGFKVMLKRR